MKYQRWSLLFYCSSFSFPMNDDRSCFTVPISSEVWTIIALVLLFLFQVVLRSCFTVPLLSEVWTMITFVLLFLFERWSLLFQCSFLKDDRPFFTVPLWTMIVLVSLFILMIALVLLFLIEQWSLLFYCSSFQRRQCSERESSHFFNRSPDTININLVRGCQTLI